MKKILLFLTFVLCTLLSLASPVVVKAQKAFQTGWWVDRDVGNPGILTSYANQGNTLVLLTGKFCGTTQLSTTLSYLNEAQKYGIQALVGLTCQQNTPFGISASEFSSIINSLKNHPALYGYYIGDEPELKDWETKHRYLATDPGYYKLIKAVDPNHPVFITHDYHGRDLAVNFFDVDDITGMHAYPFWSTNGEFGGGSARLSYDMWKSSFETAKTYRKQGFIATAQGFGDNTVYPYRNLTYKELRYQVFTAVVLGVDKVLFWMDSWGDKGGMKPLVAQIIGQIQSIGAEMNNGVTNDSRVGVSVTDRNQLVYRYGVSGTSHAILAVNIANRSSQAGATLANVQFTLPAGVNVSQVQVLHENRNLTVTNGKFTDTFAPFEVHLYRFASGSLPSPTPTPSLRRGDVNGDGKVNIVDIGIIIDHYGSHPPTDPRADLDKNGIINIVDIGIVIDHYEIAASPTPTPSPSPAGGRLNFYGVEFAGPRSYAELASLGIMNPITDVDINNPNNWEGTIDEAISTARSLRSQYPNFKPILWQKGLSDNVGWSCNGVNNVGKAFITYLNTKNYWDDILAIYGMQEVLGVNVSLNSCSNLEQIKSVVAQIKQLSGGRAKIYHKLYSDTSCDLDPNCLVKKLGFADGICDYCGVLYHPYRYSPREFRKTQMLSALEKDLNLIKSVPPGVTLNSFMAYICTIHWPELWVYGTGLYMPSPAEMYDGASSVINYVSSKGYRVDGFSWYAWDNHPAGYIALGQYNADGQRAGRMEVARQIGKLR